MPPSVLHCIDRVQDRFLREMGLTDVVALCKFRLAPLQLRRDIAVLGLLRRVNLGLVSEQIASLFPKIGVRQVLGQYPAARVRTASRYHNKQLLDRISPDSSMQMQRSILGMVHCYNCLLLRFVDLPSVRLFQRGFQKSAMERAGQGHAGWQDIFEFGRPSGNIVRFHT